MSASWKNQSSPALNTIPTTSYRTWTKLRKPSAKILKNLGNAARIKDLGAKLGTINNHVHQSRIAFLGGLSSKFVVLKPDEHHHHGICLADKHDHQDLRLQISNIVKHITDTGQPVSVEQIHANLQKYNPQHLHALASLSKKLSCLNRHWGLSHWPTVNPKNIRDKIFIILRDNGKPMHFSKIAQSIRESSFERREVTTQAIHKRTHQRPSFRPHRSRHLRP